MTSGLRGITDRLLPEVPVRRLAAVRILVAAYVAVDLLAHHHWIGYGDAPAALYHPRGPLAGTAAGSLLDAARLGTAELTLLWSTCLTLAVLALAGRWSRAGCAVLAVTYWWWVVEHHAYGLPTHGRTAIVVALAALATAPAGAAWSLDACRRRRRGLPAEPSDSRAAGWVLSVIALQLTYLYLSSAIWKLAVGGPSWWSRGAVDTGIVLFGPSWAVRIVGEHPGAVHAAALAALLWELCAPLLLVPGRPRRLFAASAIAFHLGVLATMRIDFTGTAVACLALLLASRPARQPAAVSSCEPSPAAADITMNTAPCGSVRHAIRPQGLSCGPATTWPPAAVAVAIAASASATAKYGNQCDGTPSGKPSSPPRPPSG